MKGKIVRDIEGRITVVLEECVRGVIVDWGYVEEKINPRIADKLRSE